MFFSPLFWTAIVISHNRLFGLWVAYYDSSVCIRASSSHIDAFKHNWAHAHAQRHVTPANHWGEKKLNSPASIIWHSSHLSSSSSSSSCSHMQSCTHILTDYRQRDFKMHFRSGGNMPVEGRKRRRGCMWDGVCTFLIRLKATACF